MSSKEWYVMHIVGDMSAAMQSLSWAHKALWLDFVVYSLFLVTFLLSALMPFHQVAWDGYQLINTFTKYAAALELPDPSNSFTQIHSVVDFWSWWDGPFRYAGSENGPDLQAPCSHVLEKPSELFD
jgi:hypothetical protein